MAGFNSIPASGGGGGLLPNMTFVGSVHMSTFNRSWSQAGTAGFYAIYSANQENGYAYFVGSTTQGIPLNRMMYIAQPFTSINIVGTVNDLVSLYKVKVKNTSVFPEATNTFPYSTLVTATSVTLTTSNPTYSIPNNALPLINLLMVGGGGAGGSTHCGAGGGGGAVVKLSGFPVLATNPVTIGAGSGPSSSGSGGSTYFGTAFALGGGNGGDHSWIAPQGTFGNGGGAPGHNPSSVPGKGSVQTWNSTLGEFLGFNYHGGNSGGGSSGADTQQSSGGGGGGAGAEGTAGNNSTPGSGGIGHTSDISGTSTLYGNGGPGGRANNGNPASHGGGNHQVGYGYGGRGAGYQGSGHTNGGNGAIVVRYYVA
jgi:hypothetical protein